MKSRKDINHDHYIKHKDELIRQMKVRYAENREASLAYQKMRYYQIKGAVKCKI